MRPQFPQHAHTALLPCIENLKDLLNQSGRYVEVGGLPNALAPVLGVPQVDSTVCLACLQELSSRDTSARGRRHDAQRAHILLYRDCSQIHVCPLCSLNFSTDELISTTSIVQSLTNYVSELRGSGILVSPRRFDEDLVCIEFVDADEILAIGVLTSDNP